jgi:DNA-binding winged helix-turn-helix (wHTH) protein/DNA polymerase III delta prime subunit
VLRTERETGVQTIYVFDGHELDPARFALRRGELCLPVQPKVLRLLFYLVARRERVVSGDELLEALWPGETVCRESIKRAVSGARRALGESGGSQRTIRTVRGHGYQFVRAVEVLPGGATPPPETPAPAPTRRTDGDMFVGRAELMRALEEGLHGAVAGAGRFMLLVGEPGIGKTRTALELARRAGGLGAQCWFGRCLEEGGAPPFWPWLQIVREGLAGCGAAELARLMGQGAADIAEALPELRDALPDLCAAPAIGSVPARFRFFESMLAFLRRADQQRPLVIVLDDLQQADGASLLLLAFVARQLASTRILLVGTARRAAARASHGLYALLPELLREELNQCLELTGFSAQELGCYLELATGRAAPAEVVASLHERTAGNPLFFRQLVSGAKLEGGAEPAWRALLGAPSSEGVRGAIQRHLQALSEASCGALRTAAVLGREFCVAALAELCGLGADTQLRELADPLALGLLQALPKSGRYRFTHALIRDALYEQLPPEQRSLLHARAARALEARHPAPGDDVLAEIAAHYWHAAPAHDAGRALSYARRCADVAMQRLAYEDAALQLEHALHLLSLVEHERALEARLLLARGEAQLYAADANAARASLWRAFEVAREQGDLDVIARTAALFASPPLEAGAEHELQQTAVLREALSLLGPEDARRPELLALLAKSLLFSRAREQQAALVQEAWSAARQLAPAQRAAVLEHCHEALSEPDQLPTRLKIGDELLDLAHELGDHRLLLCAWTNRVQGKLECGELQQVDAAMQSLELVSQRVREPFHRWRARTYRSTRELLRGDLALAERYALEARELGAAVGREHAQHCYCVQVSGLMRLQGRLREAHAVVQEVVCGFPKLTGWQALLACIELDLGKKDAGKEVLARVMSSAPELSFHDPFGFSVLAPLAELSDRLVDLEASERIYAMLSRYEGCQGVVHFGMGSHGPIARILGMLAARLGDLPAATRHFERAIAMAEAMPSDLYACLGALLYARALLALGGRSARPKAAGLLSRALQLARSHAMHGIVHTCRYLATHHELRVDLGAVAS